ncbi:MAG: filamentous hemagglutinin N-terminal domain-containing protein, partial [Moorea sp. SIO4A3]|nr:filamentous hemagglutinin N-terminal domain-containing protein [Moorena sp. SIO4A3]
RGGLADLIEGGAERGANLFHSFTDFNVEELQRVYFANPAGIDNIISRVTGTNPSSILGTLGVDGAANLFLLNPHGIIFGANAQLDIQGSFVASTANSITFGDGSSFSANPDNSSLLTVSVPLGLQYGTNQAGAIANAGNLAVGKDLTLSAGNLDLQGQLYAGRDLTLEAQDTVRIRDSVIAPFIAAARGQFLVQGNEAVDIFALNHPDSGLFSGGDMVLQSPSQVGGDAHYWSGGSFRIERLDGSLGDLYSPHDPIIRARGDVSFDAYIGASLHIFAGGSVTIPAFVLITDTDTAANSIQEDVTLSDGVTLIAIDGSTQPTLDIRAGTTAFEPNRIIGNGFFFPQPPSTNAPKTSADISLGLVSGEGALIFLTNQYEPNTALSGGTISVFGIVTASSTGNGGDIIIDSRSDISALLIDSSSSGGNGGNVIIDSRSDISALSIDSSSSAGNGGDIIIDSQSDISALSIDSSSSAGNGGTIKLLADGNIIQIFGGEFNSSSSASNGNAGNGGAIFLHTDGNISLPGNLDSRSIANAGGNAGDGGEIFLEAGGNITTGGFVVSNQINLQSGSVSLEGNAGNGGTISLEAGGEIDLGKFDSNSFARNGDAGDGGQISLNAITGTITTKNLRSESGSGNGNAANGGEINLRALGDIHVTEDLDSDSISAAGGDSGNGGAISLETAAGSIFAENFTSNSFARNGDAGNGGQISLNAITGTITTKNLRSESGSGNGNAANGGEINLRALGDIRVTKDLDSESISAAGGDSGNGGAISLETAAGSIFAENFISNSIASNGDAGDGGQISLNAITGTITTDNLNSQSASDNGNAGNGGRINFTALGDIRVTEDLDSSSVAGGDSGNGGAISLETAAGSISAGNFSSNSFARNGDAGDGGQISLNAITGTITTKKLSSESGSGNGNTGNGGRINLTALGDIRIEDLGSPSISVAGGDSGNGGAISLETAAGSIFAENFNSNSFAGNGDAGNGGQISLNAITGTITTKNLRSESGSGNGNAANGGEINLRALGDIRVTKDLDSDSVSVAGGDSGNGGAISLETAAGSITTGNFDAGTVSVEGDAGDGGIISLAAFHGTITTGNLKSEAGSNNGNAGDGGEITLEARNNITTGDLNSRSFGSLLGNGGNINLTSTAESITTGSISSGGSFDFGGFGNSLIGEGNRGNVTLDAYRDLILSPLIDASGSGPGGNITLTSRTGEVSLKDGLINSNGFGNGSGGKIKIEGQSVSIINTDLTTRSSGQGNGGSLILTTPGSVSLDSSRITTSLEPGAIGQGGDIRIEGASVSLSDFTIDTATFGQGNAGKVSIKAEDFVSLISSAVFSITAGEGNAGSVTVEAGGNVWLKNSSNISTAVDFGAVGNGGNVDINAYSLLITDGSQLQALTLGTGDLTNDTGNSGNISINVLDSVTISGVGSDGFLSGIFTSSEAANSGQGGNIEVTADNLLVSNGAVFSAQTFSTFDGGDITVQVSTLELRDGGQFLTSTFNSGKAGNIIVTASDKVTITGSDPNFAQRVNPTPLLRNDIDVSRPTILFEAEPNNSITQAQELDRSFSINSPDAANPLVEFSTRIPYVSVSGKGSEPATSDYYSFEVGTAGTRAIIDIDTFGNSPNLDTVVRLFDSEGNLLASNDDAPASLGAFGSQSNNDSYLRHVITLPGTYFIQVTQSGNVGISDSQAYNLQVSLDTPKVVASVVNAGSVSGMFAKTQGTGTGGNINLSTTNLDLSDQAEISAQALGQGNAGNININVSDRLTATDGNIITATTQSAGGAIDITAKDIRLRGDSDITTSVFSGADNGGNITITTDSLIAFADSDILAFARDGRGGDITFKTPIFFGFAFRPAPKGTDPATLDNNNRVDINASGAIDGVITLPNLDFIENSLTELPDNLIDTDNLLANSCIVRTSEQEGQFIITGGGNLPTRPGDASVSRYPTGEVRTVPSESASRPWQKGDPIVEATGVYQLPNGRLVMGRECS